MYIHGKKFVPYVVRLPRLVTRADSRCPQHRRGSAMNDEVASCTGPQLPSLIPLRGLIRQSWYCCTVEQAGRRVLDECGPVDVFPIL